MLIMKDNYQKFIAEIGIERVRLNEPLFNYSTFKIGGPADMFIEIENVEEIKIVLALIKKFKIPYFVLGGGSNVLISDKGFRGVVLKLKNEKLTVEEEGLFVKVTVGGGMLLSKLVNELVKLSITGLEFAAGIPGTVGGAIRGNSGAWRESVGDKIEKVKILDEKLNIVELNQENIKFDYRDSRFKHNNELILEGTLILKKGSPEEIEAKVIENLEKRSSQPNEPSAGCVFVNPGCEGAGSLIDKCGLKGVSVGGAQISLKHANFIINTKNAKAQDVISLIDLAKQKVKEKFQIDLKEEIVRIGEF